MQFSKFEARNDGTELNLEEYRANFVLFSFVSSDLDVDGFVNLDPRMGSLAIWEQNSLPDESSPDKFKLNRVQRQLSIDEFSPENFPEIFEQVEVPDWLTSFGSLPLTSKELRDVNIANRYDSPPTKSFVVAIRECLPEDLPSDQQCATEDEAIEYLSKIHIEVAHLNSFVDFEEVKPDPVEGTFRFFGTFAIVEEFKSLITINYIESRITLMDKLWQTFVQPDEYRFLNLGPRV